MATAPTVPNFAQYNYEIGDTADVVIKQNGLNGALLQFGNSLSTMTGTINTDLQTMEGLKTDTQQAAQAASEEAQQIAQDKQAVADDRAHVDQQKGIVDTKTQQVSDNAQQVALDKQAVADDRLASEQAAGASTDAATASIQAKNDAQALYGDLNAVDTAKNEAQQAATKAGEERGLAVQARQGAETAQQAAETAASESQQTVGQAITALKAEDDPFTQYFDQERGDERYLPRRKNALINGNFDFWNRATSQTSGQYGSDDRWVNDHNGSSKTHSRQAFAFDQTAVPGYPAYFSRTVVNSVAGAENYVLKRQRIERATTFAGKKATLSFYAKADSTKDIAIELEQFFATGTNVTGIDVKKITLSSSWQKFALTFDVPTPILASSNNSFLGVNFWFDAGANFNGRTLSLGNQSGTFDISKVQFEEGVVATEFEDRPLGLELLLCRRYYYRYSDTLRMAIVLDNTAHREAAIQFPASMRVTPSVLFNGGDTGNALATANANGIIFFTTNAPPGLWSVINDIRADAEL